MKKHSKKIDIDPQKQDYYGTGSTNPPKDRGGLVAVLLVMVILLGGTCSALGIMNMRLIRQITAQDDNPGTLNVFSTAPHASVPAAIGSQSDSTPFPRMGLEGQTVTEFDRRFYRLPQGVLITGVITDQVAHLAGLRPGDIIILLDGDTVESLEDLFRALENRTGEHSVKIEFYRHQTGQTMHTTLVLPGE